MCPRFDSWWHHSKEKITNQRVTNYVALFFYSQKRQKKAKNKTKNRFFKAVVSTKMSTVNQMSETVNIVCYKWKTLSNGEYPLMLCICKDRKRKYQSIGVSINPIYWDFDKNKPKPKCPNRAYICKLISEKLNSVNTEIIRLHSENKDFTAKSVVDSHRKSHKSTTVEAVFNQFIKRLCDENRRGYMLSVKQVYNSLVSYNGHLDICFNDIDVEFLRNYEAWLRKKGLAENTISILSTSVWE